MLYAHIRDSKPEHFKRLTGVSPATFGLMVATLTTHLPTRGRPPALCLPDRLLLVLMFWREYRTQAHIAATYQVSEATVSRTVRLFETLLLRDRRFHLPGKKALLASGTAFAVVLVDATECPIERPKKDRGGTTPARRSATPTRPRSS